MDDTVTVRRNITVPLPRRRRRIERRSSCRFRRPGRPAACRQPAWVTLPVSLFGLGLAIGTLPAAFVRARLGRRGGYLFGALFGLAAGLIAAFASSYRRSYCSASAALPPVSTVPPSSYRFCCRRCCRKAL